MFTLAIPKLGEGSQMSPLDKAVMDSFITAATRHASENECERIAVETWIALNPGADTARARREVRDTLTRLRLLEESAEEDGACEEERQRVFAIWQQAQSIGLHPDNCLARAVELWLRDHPEDDRPTAERRVSRIINIARREA